MAENEELKTLLLFNLTFLFSVFSFLFTYSPRQSLAANGACGDYYCLCVCLGISPGKTFGNGRQY